MAQGTTLFRFKVSLSNVDRSVYETIAFRLALHPSETEVFLLSRVIAYLLNFQEGIEFSQGLSVPDEPSLRVMGPNQQINLWIDIGSPTSRRIHKASKSAKQVLIYTYKNPDLIKKEVLGEAIHKIESIEVFTLDQTFLNTLASTLERDNTWTVLFNDGELIINIKNETYLSRIESHRLTD